jgi:hypothetical protein
MTTKADELIVSADVALLYDILGEFVEIAKLFEDSKQMIELISKLNRFVNIHKVRCDDLMLLKSRIDTAREEYQSLSLKYKGTKEALEQLQRAHNQLLESKL